MPRGLRLTAFWVCIAVAGVTLAGCAETTYPELPTVPAVRDSLLTPSEQEKAIRDLSSEKVHGSQAEKKIEGR